MYPELDAKVDIEDGSISLYITGAPRDFYLQYTTTRQWVDFLAEHRPDLYEKVTKQIQEASSLYTPPKKAEYNDYD